MTIGIVSLIIGALSLFLAILNMFFIVEKIELSLMTMIILMVLGFGMIGFGIYSLISFTSEDTTSSEVTTFFSDVKVGDWCYDAVEYLYSRDLIIGTSEKQFAPEEPATRAMVITLLYRLEGEPMFKDVVAFNDVQWDQYYSNAVTWAAINDIVVGSDGAFNPDTSMTREQIASILYRYHVVYKGYQVTNTGDELNMFLDWDKVSEYAVSSVAWAIQSDLFLDIIDDYTIKPGRAVTRAQAAVIFMRYCKNVI